jgi:hypothetical protein
MAEINSPTPGPLPILTTEEGELAYSEWLLRHTISDVEARSKNPETTDRYTLLGIAPLLRKLVADQHNLVHVVRRHRPSAPIGFRITPYDLKPASGSLGWSIVFSFGREELLPVNDTPPVTLKALLKTTVGQHEDYPVSVLELIHYYAHIEGGVHMGTTKGAFEEELLRVSPTLLTVSRGYLQSLAYIGQIVVAGLSELRAASLERSDSADG